MPKRRLSMQASEGRTPQTFFTPPAAPSPSPFWQSPSPQLPNSPSPSPPSQTPQVELEAGASDSEQSTATSWAFTTLGSYVPETIMNLFAAPLRAADRFVRRVLHPQQIRIENIVREDGARKVRLVSPRARDVVTPTKARSSNKSEKDRATQSAMQSPYNIPGAWPTESVLGPPPVINVSSSPFVGGPQTPPQRSAIYDQYDLIANLDDLGSPDWASTPPPQFNDMLAEHDSPLLQHFRPQPEIAAPKNIFLTPYSAAASRLSHDRVHALRNVSASPLKPHKITSPKLRERYQYQSKKAQSPPRVHKRNNRRGLQSILRSKVDDSYNIWIAEATRDYATDQNPHNVGDTNQNSAKTLSPSRATAPEFAVGSPSPYDNDESMLPDAPEVKHIHFNDVTRVKEFLPYHKAVYQVDGRDQLPYLDRSLELESIEEGKPVRSPLTGFGSKYFKTAFPYSFKAVFVDSNVTSMQDQALEQVKQKLHAAYDEQDSLLENIKEKDEDASFVGETKTFDGRFRGVHRLRDPKDEPLEDESGHVFYIDSSDEEDGDDVDGPSLGEDTELEIKISDDGTKEEKKTDDVIGPVKVGDKKSLEESMLSLELEKKIIASLPIPIPPPPPPVLAPLVAELTVLEITELDTAVQKAQADRSTPLVRYMSVHDFGTLLPLSFRGDPLAWLNDNIVNEYLDILTNHVKQAENYTHKRDGKAPPVHNFSSQWYTTMMKNEKSVARWAGRKQLGGKNFLNCRLVLFPICDGNHWRLVSVKPQDRLIEYFDSLGGSGHQYTRAVLRYVELELGEHFVASEWHILGADKSEQKSQRQANASDCGLFTLLNALVLLRGEEHTRVEVTKFMNDARKRVAITLLAGKATTEFD